MECVDAANSVRIDSSGLLVVKTQKVHGHVNEDEFLLMGLRPLATYPGIKIGKGKKAIMDPNAETTVHIGWRKIAVPISARLMASKCGFENLKTLQWSFY